MDTSTKTNFGARSYAGEADLQPICDLLNACDAADKLDDNYDLTGLRLFLDTPEIDKQRDLRIWEDASGRLVGFGRLYIAQQGDPVDGRLTLRVHPEARGQGLETQIIAWGGERAREVARERNLPAV